jgi:hypothetical protein
MHMELNAPNPFDRRRLTEEVLNGWQNLMDLGAELFGVKAGLITRLMGDQIEVFLSSRTAGNPYPAGYTDPFPNSGWFCEQTLKQHDLLLIPDASESPIWKDNAAVVSFGMVSYVGLPLARPDGGLFGTVCFIDDRANAHSALHFRLLEQIRHLIELNLRIVHDTEEIASRDRILDGLSRIYPICSYCKKVRDGASGSWIDVEQYMAEVTGQRASHSVCPQCFQRVMKDLDEQEAR